PPPRQRAPGLAAPGERGAALEDIDAALAGLEEIRTKLVAADFIRQEFNRSEERIYSQAIALKLGEGRADAALETAELARSRAFLELLAARNLRAPSGDPAAGGAGAPATARGITALAARLRSTFVQYWLTEDELIIFVVTPDGRTRARQASGVRSRGAAL